MAIEAKEEHWFRKEGDPWVAPPAPVELKVDEYYVDDCEADVADDPFEIEDCKCADCRARRRRNEPVTFTNYPRPEVNLGLSPFADFPVYVNETSVKTPDDAEVMPHEALLGWHRRHKTWVVVYFLKGRTKKQVARYVAPRFGTVVDSRGDEGGDNLTPYAWIEGNIIHY